MTDEPQLRVVKVPMLDTGIGHEAGYANDAELVAAHERMLAEPEPSVRELLERMMQAELRAVLYGIEP